MVPYNKMKTLLICIDNIKDEKVIKKYRKSVQEYNRLMNSLDKKEDIKIETGFNLYTPNKISISSNYEGQPLAVDLRINVKVVDDKGYSYPFYLYPLESILNNGLYSEVSIIEETKSIWKKYTTLVKRENKITYIEGTEYAKIVSNDLIPFKKVKIVSKEKLLE